MNPHLTQDPQLEEVIRLEKEYTMRNYARQEVCFVRGEGAKLWDTSGKEYLDLLAGIAVCGVGHCHPHVVDAIAKQAGTLMHVSNLYHNALQADLAKRLCTLSGMDRAFFANSGAEANECAIKIARKWGKEERGPDCFEIVTFYGSFHGRTLATVTATAQPKYQDAFKPLPPGFKYVHVGDLEELKANVSEKTCAIMIEPIQGESGVKPVPHEFLQELRKVSDEVRCLLIFDEIQCGIGRTGKFLASEWSGVKADIVTLAKSIADGVPMGACLARGSAACTLQPGDHGSTFGGQPLACAAALAVLDVMENEGLMQKAESVGAHLQSALRKLGADLPGVIKEVRGAGLMIGVELVNPNAKLVLSRMMKAGFVLNAVGDNILRMLPPLVITKEQCDTAVDALKTILSQIETEAGGAQ
ncbi:MAG: acetylornithine transaminase [Chthonomonadales bacterium]